MPARAPHQLGRLTPDLRVICELELGLGNRIECITEPVTGDGHACVTVRFARPLSFRTISSRLPLPAHIEPWETRDPHYPLEAGYVCSRTRHAVAGPRPRPAGVTLGALWAALFTLGSAAVVAFALVRPGDFAGLARQHPFAAGFVKLFFLGTFGELLKRRLKTRSWVLDRPAQRAAVWGLFGVWFAVAFPAFEAAVEGLVARGLWPARLPGVPEFLWLAFSKSFWLNALGMYGWGMMLTHNYLDFVLGGGWRTWSLRAWAEQADARFLLAFIPKTLLFWIAAQTFNYSLPAEWRVFVAALLAIVLGFLLGVSRGRRAA